MAAIGVSLLLRMAVFALTVLAALASSAADCTVRFQGALIRTALGHWDVQVEVVNGAHKVAPDYEKTMACGSCGFGFGSNNVSSLDNISATDSNNMGTASNRHQTAAVGLGALLDAGDGAVVTLVAGQTRLAVHRKVLITGSPVFAAKFSRDSVDAEVLTSDVEGPVLRQLVAFLYTGRAPQLPSMAPHLLAAAEKYGVAALKAASEQQLVEQLTVENAPATAVLALRHSCHCLRKAAVHFIKAHLHEVMATQGWKDMALYHSTHMVEVIRLLAEAPAEAGDATATTVPATADSKAAPTAVPTAASATADISAASTTSAAIAANNAFPTTTRPPMPDAAAISHLRSLSREKKSRRLIQAAKDGAVEEVWALLVAGVGVDVQVRVRKRNTALHYAAYNGNAAVVRLLLAAWADPNARAWGRNTPLHYAAYSGHAEAVWLLLAASADPNARDDEWRTPLHLAAEQGKAEAALALLEGGADRAARTKWGKQTALDLAINKKNHHLVQILQ